MKSWIHEIAESYTSTHKPVRRDLKENYISLNEEQKFSLLSENFLNYLDEQLQNAFGFGVSDLTEQELGQLIRDQLRGGGMASIGNGRAFAGPLARGLIMKDPEAVTIRGERLERTAETILPDPSRTSRTSGDPDKHSKRMRRFMRKAERSGEVDAGLTSTIADLRANQPE